MPRKFACTLHMLSADRGDHDPDAFFDPMGHKGLKGCLGWVESPPFASETLQHKRHDGAPPPLKTVSQAISLQSGKIRAIISRSTLDQSVQSRGSYPNHGRITSNQLGSNHGLSYDRSAIFELVSPLKLEAAPCPDCAESGMHCWLHLALEHQPRSNSPTCMASKIYGNALVQSYDCTRLLKKTRQQYLLGRLELSSTSC